MTNQWMNIFCPEKWIFFDFRLIIIGPKISTNLSGREDRTKVTWIMSHDPDFQTPERTKIKLI